MAYKQQKVETNNFKLWTERVSGKGKVLGVGWKDKSDKFLFDMKKIADMSDDLYVTKQGVLERLEVFDHSLGLFQPLNINMNF